MINLFYVVKKQREAEFIMTTTTLCKKLIATILAVSLVIPNSALAQFSFATMAAEINPSELPISIPADIGTIRDFHIASKQQKSDKPFFIYIQDAHANFEAQKSIKEILTYLTKEYGLKVVGVEGAISPLEPNVLKFFKDKGKNNRIAERLVKSGELSGVEWFAVENTAGNVKLAGIEDSGLYRDNILAYRNLIKRQSEVTGLMKNLDGSIQNLKGKFYNSSLLQFDRKITKGKDNIFSSISFLHKKAGEDLKLDFNAIENQVKYPFFARLSYLMETEKKLDLKKITQEKDLFVKELRGKLDKLAADAEQTISILETVTPGKSHEIDRSKYKSFDEYFEKIYQYGRDAQMNFAIYENFRRWASVLILQEEIQQEGLSEEIEQLVGLLYDRYAATAEEKEIVSLGREIEIIHKLVRGELTRPEYEKIVKNPSNIEPLNLRKRMEAVAQRSDGRDKKNVSLVGSVEDWSKLKVFYDLAMKFYEGTLLRDQSMVKNGLSLMKSAGANQIAIVCGGFHTDGMASLLKEQNTGYVIVTPHVKLEAEGNTKYHESILETRKTIFDVSKIASIIKLVDDQVYARQLPGNLANRNAVLGEEALVELVSGIQAAVNAEIQGNPALAQLFPAMADALATALTGQINEWVTELSANPIASRVAVSRDLKILGIFRIRVFNHNQPSARS